MLPKPIKHRTEIARTQPKLADPGICAPPNSQKEYRTTRRNLQNLSRPPKFNQTRGEFGRIRARPYAGRPWPARRSITKLPADGQRPVRAPLIIERIPVHEVHRALLLDLQMGNATWRVRRVLGQSAERSSKPTPSAADQEI